MDQGIPLPFHQAGGDGRFQRHVVDGWMKMMDLGKPIIAQVRGNVGLCCHYDRRTT